MAALPSVPKSISYSLKDCAKDYFDKNLNYSMPCPVYKLDTELTALRAQVYKDLELKYSDAFAKSSLILFNLKNVNDFVKKLHAKANLSAEGDAQRRELNRLSNVAAKERKSRNIQEKAEEEKTRAELMELLNDQATLAEGVLRRARQWESLLYSTEGVSFEGIVLLTDDEKNLMVLKTDIDNIFLQLRGEATVLSSRCLKIVIEMERIMKLLRSHPCVQHLVQFVSVREIVSNVLEPTYVTPPKQHRGTALGSTKWRVGDAPEGRVGGIKVLHLNVRNRATHLDKKAKVFHDLLSTRVVVEEKILSSTTVRGVQRKSLVFSTEEAKKEAQCPTKMSEQSDETLEELIQAKAKELGDLLQEELQRRNNKNEGELLKSVPKGTVTLLVADPSAIKADGFSSHGVAKGRARLFSDLMGSASHDCRQYTAKTKHNPKPMKYVLRTRVTTSDS